MILVTGGNGFVGSAVLKRAIKDGQYCIRATVRQASSVLPSRVEKAVIGNIAPDTDWALALEGVSIIVHCAARVHVMQEANADPLAEYRRVNALGTLNLAQQAAISGVRRFVFVSSIGVNGAATSHKPFTSEDQAQPHSPYAQSKYEAELGLQALAAETGMEVVIIRPPLVYGPGAPGNFGRR